MAAAVILLVEGALAITGWPQQALAACALLIAPGLAVLALLPRELRRLPVAVPVVPIAGFVVSTILLVSLSAVGLALDDLTIRAGLGAVVLAGLIASRFVDDGRPVAHHRGAFPALLGLAGIAGLGVALQALVIGGTPLPGEDWGEYLLYAQEIEREQALLIDNPYWMLGGDWFPLDPGVPAVYGAFLTLADVPATALLHGIWVFAVLAILAVFVLAAALWGATAGLVGAGLYAVAPMTLNMLAWHGLPNVAALSLIPVALFAAGVALRGDETRRHAAVLGCGLVALAAVHRFSFVLGLLAVVGSLAFGLVRRPGAIARFAGWTIVAAVVAGTAVAIDLVRRNSALGGTQGYEAFLPTKVDWELVARDLTWPVLIVGLVALVAVLVVPPFLSDPSRFVLAGLAVSILALTYAWIAHVPTGYNRAAYFVPLLLAPTLGLLASKVPPIVAIAAAAALVGVTAAEARDLAPGLPRLLRPRQRSEPPRSRLRQPAGRSQRRGRHRPVLGVPLDVAPPATCPRRARSRPDAAEAGGRARDEGATHPRRTERRAPRPTCRHPLRPRRPAMHVPDGQARIRAPGTASSSTASTRLFVYDLDRPRGGSG